MAFEPSHEFCQICGSWTGDAGLCWDIHMTLCHPETRPRPEREPDTKKKPKKKGAR